MHSPPTLRLFLLLASLAAGPCCKHSETAKQAAAPDATPTTVSPQAEAHPSSAVPTPEGADAAQPGGMWIARVDGIGPVKIGMSLPELSSVLNETFSMPEDKNDQGCFYVHPSNHLHLALMIEDGRLVRVDVDKPGIPTTEGIQVGDSETKALGVYGANLKVSEHQYTGPEGHYLTLGPIKDQYGIRFETDKGTIEMYYAGRFEAIQYVEGCL